MLETFRIILSKNISSSTNIHEWFEAISKILLSPHTNLVVLDTNNNIQRFQLIEIEFYLYDSIQHPDPYSHRRPIQLQTCGYWYFHSMGLKESSYKGGSYKGIDLTFGEESIIFGGILFRSMISLKQPYDFIEGPSKLVDRLLQVAEKSNIAELVKSCICTVPGYIDALSVNSRIRLEIFKLSNGIQLICGPRVGLPLTKMNDPLRFEYLFKSYRFVNLDYSCHIKKFISTLIISMYSRNEEIMIKNNVSKTVLQRWINSFLKGCNKKPLSFSAFISDYLELYGAWWTRNMK